MAQSYNLTVKPANNVITIARDPGARIALIVIKQKNSRKFVRSCFIIVAQIFTNHLCE
jgi:hypothetical protein